MTAVGIYARISLDRADGAGVERQMADCLELAARRGWTVVDSYVDNSVGAYRAGTVRPAYNRLMADLDAKRVNGVVVWNLDRLYRRPRELEDLLDRCEDGSVAFAACSGEYDLATSDGRFMARMMVNVANKSSADTARRVSRRILADAQLGKPHGGVRPFGYRADRVTIDPAEAAIIRECQARLVAGASIRQLCLDLNRRGVTGTGGTRWRVTSLTRALTSAHLIGIRTHRGQEYPGAWPAILTREERVAILAAVGERKLTGVPYRRHLLSGFAFCGVCGTGLQARNRNAGGKPTYVCPPRPAGQQCVSIDATALESYVLAQVGRYAMRRPTVQPIAAALDVADLEDRRRVLARVFAAGGLSARDFEAAASDVTAQIAAAESAALASVRVARVPLLEGFADLDIDRQRIELSSWLGRVEVRKGRMGAGFDPARVGLWTADGEGWDTVEAELGDSTL